MPKVDFREEVVDVAVPAENAVRRECLYNQRPRVQPALTRRQDEQCYMPCCWKNNNSPATHPVALAYRKHRLPPVDPLLESPARLPAHAECATGRPASLGAGLQSAAAVHLSAVGSLPKAEGSHRYYPAHRRGHASRCGHSSRAHSLGDFPGHELTRASEPRPMGGADAPAPSLFTCPQLCHQGDLLSITIITAPCAGGLVRFGHFPVDRPTPRRTRPVLEAELL